MYENHFKLREPPFNGTPSPKFFYTNGSHHEALATLRYGVEQRKGIIVVTGAAGTGKTTLLRRFVQEAGPAADLACILDPRLTFVELLRCVLSAFGLAPAASDRLAHLEQLKAYLIGRLEHGRAVALLIDEAQELDEQVLDELRLLADLEQGGIPLLPTVLIGQPRLEARLGQAPLDQLRQRIALRAQVEPFARDEIGCYIDFRLRTAGYRGKAIFGSAAVDRVAGFSRGIPRLINLICDHALLIARTYGHEEIGAEIIDAIAEDLQIVDREQASPISAAPGREFFRARRIDDEDEGQGSARGPGESESDSLLKGIFGFGARAVAPSQTAPAVLSGILDPLGLRRATLWATLALMIGGTWLFAARQGEVRSGSPATERGEQIEQIEEVLKPLQERIYRVFLASAPSPQAFKIFPADNRQSSGAQSGGDRSAVITEAPARPDKVWNLAGLHPAAKNADRFGRAAGLSSPPQTPGERRVPESPVRSSPAEFVVAHDSFVRDRPASEAEVITTLRPGAHVQVTRSDGQYLQVRSLDGESVRGYVHREDAFFEALHRPR